MCENALPTTVKAFKSYLITDRQTDTTKIICHASLRVINKTPIRQLTRFYYVTKYIGEHFLVLSRVSLVSVKIICTEFEQIIKFAHFKAVLNHK